MQRLLLAALLWLMPFAAFAVPHTFTWDVYPVPDATIYLSCAIGTATKQPVGNSVATGTSITFDLGDTAGQIVACVYWAQKGNIQSPLGVEVSITNPLPAPVGHLI